MASRYIMVIAYLYNYHVSDNPQYAWGDAWEDPLFCAFHACDMLSS